LFLPGKIRKKYPANSAGYIICYLPAFLPPFEEAPALPFSGFFAVAAIVFKVLSL
jgi:hypothetical protein